jgi:hypothetical protein
MDATEPDVKPQAPSCLSRSQAISLGSTAALRGVGSSDAARTLTAAASRPRATRSSPKMEFLGFSLNSLSDVLAIKQCVPLCPRHSPNTFAFKRTRSRA